jgi:phosphate transport system substrate-binding protein
MFANLLTSSKYLRIWGIIAVTFLQSIVLLHAQVRTISSPVNASTVQTTPNVDGDKALAKDAVGLFIGMNNYDPNSGFGSLRYAVNDAVSLAYLYVFEVNTMEARNVQLVVGGNPTSEIGTKLARLRSAGARIDSISHTKLPLEDLLNGFIERSANRTGLTIVSYSGHGYDDGKIMYAMPTDTKASIPYNVAGINFTDFLARLRTRRSQQGGKQIVFYDACRSIPPEISSIVTNSGARGLAGTGMLEMLRSASAKASGFAFLPSAIQGQSSYELDDKKQGAFTASILDGLRGSAIADQNGYITLGALSNYVQDKVPELVRLTVRQASCGNINAGQPPCVQTPAKMGGDEDAQNIPLAISFSSVMSSVMPILRGKVSETNDPSSFTRERYSAIDDSLGRASVFPLGEQPWEFLEVVRSFANGKTHPKAFMAYLNLVEERKNSLRQLSEIQVLRQEATSAKQKLTTLQDEIAREKARARARVQANKPVTVMRIKGSNLIGHRLILDMAQAFLEQKGAKQITVLQDSIAHRYRIQSIIPGDSTRKVIEVEAHGSATAINCLKQSQCDIGMVSRELREEDQLQTIGITNEPASSHLLGMDGIAIIINANNPLSSITLDQLQKILTGEITKWSDLGIAKEGTIQVYMRDSQSTTVELLANNVLQGKEVLPQAKRLESEEQLADNVNADQNGIGLVSMSNIRLAKILPLGVSASEMVGLNFSTVLNNTYPLTRRLYLFAKPQSQNALVNEFLAFTNSEKGQQVVAQNGFVDQMPRTNQPYNVEKYKNIADNRLLGATKLSIEFYPETLTLNDRDMQDVGRLAALFLKPEWANKKIILIGHNEKGNNNKQEAKQRADIVARTLRAQGLMIEEADIFSAGDRIPSLNPLRSKRVEVFLR